MREQWLLKRLVLLSFDVRSKKFAIQNALGLTGILKFSAFEARSNRTNSYMNNKHKLIVFASETLVIDSEVETKRPARWPVFLFENVISLLVIYD